MTSAGDALARGELHVLGRLSNASNVALLAEVDTDEGPLRCVYKPVAGERPLWDFPGAPLAAREVLTAQAARCFGWELVPETAWRPDGPRGPGMCQRWIEAADDRPVRLAAPRAVPHGWHEIARGQDAAANVVVVAHESTTQLQRVVLLDVLVNNADRKGGHMLRCRDGTLAAIDHGVTFHAEDKLRTVLWGWAGQPVPEPLLAEVHAGAESFRALMSDAITGPAVSPPALGAAEVTAALTRLDHLLEEPLFPTPGEGWPVLPWPPM